MKSGRHFTQVLPCNKLCTLTSVEQGTEICMHWLSQSERMHETLPQQAVF